MTREDSSAAVVAAGLLRSFDRFYSDFLAIPTRARMAFEERNHAESLRLSAERLQLYRLSMGQLAAWIERNEPEVATNESRWDAVERRYRPLVEDRYAGDLAIAYSHSVRRKLYRGEWRSEDYSDYQVAHSISEESSPYLEVYPVSGTPDADTVKRILDIEAFQVPFQDADRDARRIVERCVRNFRLDGDDPRPIRSLQMFRAGFYRNRGAYLVGRADLGNDRYAPFIIALLNDEDGIYVDALITSSTYAHNMFSSTLANFHVTNTYYHELCFFLYSIMPMRPLGLHYSTIGYNHLGKVAVMNELEQEINVSGQRLDDAVGAEGTVAIGFSAADSAYVLKVVRDRPTDGYKWGDFDGVDSVLAKYSRVHDINRTDSMMDAIIYYNLRIDREWFDPGLVAKILDQAGHSVIDAGDALVFRYLIVQRKLTPLPVYLESATEHQARTAIRNLGYCIKNNAAANIFNKDLDARNYGVSSYAKVYLFDYDALEVLTEVKVRTNQDRYEGEEDVPDWVFEDGFVFLPEEIIAGLCLPYRDLRRLFADTYPELLSVRYWEGLQDQLARGVVPTVSVYPDSEKISDNPDE